MGGGRLVLKNCGRWEIGGQNMWEVGDWHPVSPLIQMTSILIISIHIT